MSFPRCQTCRTRHCTMCCSAEQRVHAAKFGRAGVSSRNPNASKMALSVATTTTKLVASVTIVYVVIVTVSLSGVVHDWPFVELEPSDDSETLVANNGRATGQHARTITMSKTDSEENKGRVIPHVDMCNYCQTCHIIGLEDHERHVSQIMPATWSRRQLRTTTTTNTEKNKVNPTTLVRPLQPMRGFNKSHLPNCKECYGCRHRLSFLDYTVEMLDTTYEFDSGRTSAQIFRITDPLKPLKEEHVVKIWCVGATDPGTGKVPKCKPNSANEAIPNALAVQRIVDECGFRDVVSNVFVAPVNGVLPGAGFHIEWDGLWSELAKGVSLSQITYDGDPQTDPEDYLDLLMNRVNNTEVILASIFDLLTCQGDRHEGNLFFDESGHLTLIDNDECFGRAWRKVAVDSLFLPTTQAHTINHLGHDYVRKKSNETMDTPLPAVLLDYRCHVDGGKLGFNYPPQVKQCLEKFASMKPSSLKEMYGLLADQDAEMLHQRASDLLNKGFEWTLEFGWPHNPGPLTYGWAQPCCTMRVQPDDDDDVECVGEYGRNYTLPEGDPVYGKEKQESKAGSK